MPHVDWNDHEERPPPHNNTLISETGVDGTGVHGYHVPTRNMWVGGYRSIAITVNGNGTPVTVTCWWEMSDDVNLTGVNRSQTTSDSNGDTLLFQNLGHVLTDVYLEGGASIDYAVTESNQLPLAKRTGTFAVAAGNGVAVLSGLVAQTPLTLAGGQSILADTTIYSLDTWTAGGVGDWRFGTVGVGVAVPGTYRADFGCILSDSAPTPYGGNPLTLVNFAQDWGFYNTDFQDVTFGTWYDHGHKEGARSVWRLAWSQIIVVGGAGNVGNGTGQSPVIVACKQASGITLTGYATIQLTQLATATFGL